MPIKTLPLKPNGHQLAHNDGNEVKVFQHFGEDPYVHGAMSYCAHCDEAPEYRVTEEAVHVVGPCAYPDGITTVITLAVPSGKIIVTDDLRPIYDGFDPEGFASYNTSKGQAQVVEAMAAIGCAFGSVGNSRPGLYQTGEGRYVIGNPEYTEEEELVGDLVGAKDLASICTDLWAYSVADYEDWQAKGGDPEQLGWTDSIVEVPAGTYQFTHHTGEKGFDNYAAGTVIFAHIERIQ